MQGGVRSSASGTSAGATRPGVPAAAAPWMSARRRSFVRPYGCGSALPHVPRRCTRRCPRPRHRVRRRRRRSLGLHHHRHHQLVEHLHFEQVVHDDRHVDERGGGGTGARRSDVGSGGGHLDGVGRGGRRRAQRPGRGRSLCAGGGDPCAGRQWHPALHGHQEGGGGDLERHRGAGRGWLGERPVPPARAGGGADRARPARRQPGGCRPPRPGRSAGG